MTETPASWVMLETIAQMIMKCQKTPAPQMMLEVNQKKKKKLNLWPQVPLSRIDLYEEGVLLLLIDIQHILQKIIVWTPLGRVCLSKHNDFHRTIYVTHESWVTLAGLQPS